MAIVNLPNGLKHKTVAIKDITIQIEHGQEINSKKIIETYPQFFKNDKVVKKETIITEEPKVQVIKEDEELLVETPVEVEIEVTTEDIEKKKTEHSHEHVHLHKMSVKELKDYAKEQGITITKTRKKDIIAEIKA